MKQIQEKIENKDLVALLRDVLETNDRVVRQNALIVQALTVPMVYMEPDKPWENL